MRDRVPRADLVPSVQPPQLNADDLTPRMQRLLRFAWLTLNDCNFILGQLKSAAFPPTPAIAMPPDDELLTNILRQVDRRTPDFTALLNESTTTVVLATSGHFSAGDLHAMSAHHASLVYLRQFRGALDLLASLATRKLGHAPFAYLPAAEIRGHWGKVVEQYRLSPTIWDSLPAPSPIYPAIQREALLASARSGNRIGSEDRATGRLEQRCGGLLLCSPDFSSVTYESVNYSLTTDGRKGVVKLLVEEWEEGRFEVDKDRLLKVARVTGGVLSAAFKTKKMRGRKTTVAAWKGLIIAASHPDGGRKNGYYRLNIPDHGANPGAGS